MHLRLLFCESATLTGVKEGLACIVPHSYDLQVSCRLFVAGPVCAPPMEALEASTGVMNCCYTWTPCWDDIVAAPIL